MSDTPYAQHALSTYASQMMETKETSPANRIMRQASNDIGISISKTRCPVCKGGNRSVGGCTLSIHISINEISRLLLTAIPACWMLAKRGGSDNSCAEKFVFITRSLARIAPEDARIAVLDGFCPSS